MSNLENFNNIYANLAESAYTGSRPNSFGTLTELQQKILASGETVPFDFSQNVTVKIGKNKGGKAIYETTQGGTNLPNEGIVYLQPDPTLKITDKTISTQVPKMNGGYDTQAHITGEKQKGLLTDSEAGFNSYFVADTATLNKDTKQTYLAIRGSDKAGVDTLNDWIGNDANFALTNSYIPQAKLANQALVSKIKEINEQAPNAKLNVTGHSLGTMISAQAVAKLYQDDAKAFETIGEVVLFNGPDVTQSLKNLGLTDKEIKEIGKNDWIGNDVYFLSRSKNIKLMS